MDLRSYLQVIRKNWWIIIATTVLGVGGAFAVNETSTPSYQSTVSFYVTTPSDVAVSNAYTANQFALAKIGSYIELLSSDKLGALITSTTPTGLSASDVAGEITGSSPTDTTTLTATITDSDSARSFAIASAVATQFPAMVQGLDSRTDKDGKVYKTVELQLTSGPTLNASPVSPKSTTNLALGLVAGLVIGLIIAILRSLMDNTVRNTEALRTLTGLPVLAGIVADPAARREPLLVGASAQSPRAEAFRGLRTALQFSSLAEPVQLLTVTSASAGDGTTTTAINLGIVSAQSGRRVLVVDADYRDPQLATYLGVKNSAGLSEVLAGEASLAAALQKSGTDGLLVLTSGSIPAFPADVLGSPAMASLLDQLRTQFDLIIIDTPPALGFSDASAVAAQSDGVVLVVQSGSTDRSQIVAASSALEAVDARVIGCVLTMTKAA